MPMFHALVRFLNRQFDEDRIDDFARNVDEFGPGRGLNVEVLNFPDGRLARLFQSYLDNLPRSHQEVLRCLLSHALSASPPIPINFSWAPAYDYELTIWEPSCGILVQFRSPHPGSAESAQAI